MEFLVIPEPPTRERSKAFDVLMHRHWWVQREGGADVLRRAAHTLGWETIIATDRFIREYRPRKRDLKRSRA